MLQAIGALVSVPGASNTVLDASVPCATSATVALLGQEPKQLCSKSTAELLAKRAYARAAELSAPGEPFIGVACTASLRTVISSRPQCCEHKLGILSNCDPHGLPSQTCITVLSMPAGHREAAQVHRRTRCRAEQHIPTIRNVEFLEKKIKLRSSELFARQPANGRMHWAFSR
jgi:hypothetical protein